MVLAKELRLVVVLVGGLAAGCQVSTGGGPRPDPTPGPRVEAPPPNVEEREEAARLADAPVVLGVIVPRSGSPFLEQFGGLVLDGVRLAIERHNGAGGRPVELVEVDDGGDPARAAGLIGQLEARGAVGVIGPLRPESMAAAVDARRDSLLAMVSPTAPDVPRRSNVYSLNAGDTEGAEALAAYAVSVGLRQVALLYPNTAEFRRQADAFRRVLVERGGAIVADVVFASGTTTFADPVQELVRVKPQAIFVPATERDVRQIAPQIVYYGLAGGGVQILGNEAWVGEEVLRQVAARYLEGVIAATPLYKPDTEAGWQEFVTLYESTYRRSLENALPALGFDAANLLLAALDEGSIDAATVALRLGELVGQRGATGVLTVRGDEVIRRPVLVRIEKSELVPIAGGAAGPPPSAGAAAGGALR